MILTTQAINQEQDILPKLFGKQVPNLGSEKRLRMMAACMFVHDIHQLVICGVISKQTSRNLPIRKMIVAIEIIPTKRR